MEKDRQWLWRGQQRISEQASKDLLATQFNATFPFLLSLKHPAEFDSVDNLIPSFSGLECTPQGLFSHVSLFPWDSSNHTNVSFQQGQRMDPGSQIIRLFILSLSAGAVFEKILGSLVFKNPPLIIHIILCHLTPPLVTQSSLRKDLYLLTHSLYCPL